jgi:hypothetical protein
LLLQNVDYDTGEKPAVEDRTGDVTASTKLAALPAVGVAARGFLNWEELSMIIVRSTLIVFW